MSEVASTDAAPAGPITICGTSNSTNCLLQLPPTAATIMGVHNSMTCGACAAAASGHAPTGVCVCASMPRPPHLGVRSPQSSFESNGDVGQISMNWMRMTGAIAPSKILNSDYGSATSTPTAVTSTSVAPSGSVVSSAVAAKDSRDPTFFAVSNPSSVSSIAGLEGSCHKLATVTAAATTSQNVVDTIRRKDSIVVGGPAVSGSDLSSPHLQHLTHIYSHKAFAQNHPLAAGSIRPSSPPATSFSSGNAATTPIMRAATVTSAAPSTSLNILPSHQQNSGVGGGAHTIVTTTADSCCMGRPSLSALNMTVTVDAERSSRRSLSLKSISDLELQRAHDESRIPLMKNDERQAEKGGRLIHRQYLFHVRRVTSDFALLFSLLGIALMVVENELGAAHIYDHDSPLRIGLRLLIFISTLILVALVVKFHVHEIQLYMNANSVADWWIAMTPHLCFQLALEVLVCSICPLPTDLSYNWITYYEDGRPSVVTHVPVDVLLSIPMFFRLYWVWRVMLQHSRLFTDNCNRSIAGLNRVNLNSRFILKILMTLCPGTMLMVFTASLWIIAGWVIRLCERHYDGDPVNVHSLKHQNYLNSLWLIAITFLGVGYGDIVPNTYCGRLTAVLVGILGTGTSSMVVAVIARKLELTRAEKHVHNFMMDSQLTKQLKHSAANVLRETWLIYKYRILAKDKVDKEKVRHHQRKFLVAIYALRKVKRDQRKLNENSVSLGDVAKTTSNSYEVIRDIHAIQEGLALRVTSVEHQLSDIQRELADLASLLRASLKKQQQQQDGDGGGSGGGRRMVTTCAAAAAGSLRRRQNNASGNSVKAS